MKKTLLALAVTAAAVSAQADTKLYGHVSYNIRDTDGVDDITFDRHGFSESRFGFRFSKQVGSVKALAFQEFGIAEGEGALDARKQAFGFSGSWGRVLLGEFNDVGDGILHADLAGTAVVDGITVGSAGASGIGVNGFDPGRGEALRYYSPKLGGIATVGVQYQEFGGYEIAFRLNAGGFRFYAYTEDGGENGAADLDDNQGILVGYKIAGFSATYVASERENDTANLDVEHQGLRLGYATGKHKFSISQASVETDGVDAEPESTSVEYLYNMAKGVQLWAQIEEVDNDDGTDDLEAIGVGGRIKF